MSIGIDTNNESVYNYDCYRPNTVPVSLCYILV